MGRPERPLDPSAGPVHRFAGELRELRRTAGGLPYRVLAKRANFSPTALSEAAGGETVPSLTVTLAYVAACGGDLVEWEARWRGLVAELAQAGAAAAVGANAAEPAGVVPPYLGLTTFQSTDAERFFGREALVKELVDRLSSERFLAVFGASGSGKSSVLRAGLLPAIARDERNTDESWSCVLLTPGERPLEELALAAAGRLNLSASALLRDLRDDPRGLPLAIRQTSAERARVLVVVDQFEELFTLCHDDTERARFIGALLGVVEDGKCRGAVVIGMRADFYARCADHPALVAALRDRQVLIGAMAEPELRAAITEPAAGAGQVVEPALVTAILDDVRGEPGSLPLVSHALLETWKRRRGRTLTLADYHDAGGVRGAIAQTADGLYGTLDAHQQNIVQQIFLRLTAPGEGTEDTRRRARRAELLDTPDAQDVSFVLARLADARLVTLDEDTVNVTHESLIRGWPRLQAWINEDRDLLRAHRRLTEAAVDWANHAREPALLYRGTRLDSWRDRSHDRLNLHEREYLAASLRYAERERRRRRRRIQVTVTGLVAGIVAISLLAVVAGVAAGRAVDQQRLSASRQLAADSARVLPVDPELSLLLARRAYEVDPNHDAQTAIRQAANDSRIRVTLVGHQGETTDVATSPDGTRIVTCGQDGTVRIWPADGGRPAILRGHKAGVRGVAASPDGRLAASGGKDNTVRLWSLADNRTVRVMTGHIRQIDRVTFSPDGRMLASASVDNTVRIWPVTGNGAPIVLGTATTDDTHRLREVAFSPDGALLATSYGDGMIKVWDWAAKEVRHSWRGDKDTVEALAYSRNGKYIVSGGYDGLVKVWSPNGAGQPITMPGHDGSVEGLAVSPDSTQVASVGGDGTVRIWPASGVGDRQVLAGHQGPTWSVKFSPDGRRVVTSSNDGTARVWQVDSGQPTALTGSPRFGTSAIFSPDGKSVASAGDDGAVRIQPATGGTAPLVLHGSQKTVWALAYSRDGKQVAAAGDEGTVHIWPTDRESSGTLWKSTKSRLFTVAFSPDGRSVAAGGDDGVVRIWPVNEPRKAIELNGHHGWIYSVAFSPDGSRLAAAAEDGSVQVWPLEARGRPVLLTGHKGLIYNLVISPDGQHVASAGFDGTVRIRRMDGRGEAVVLRGHQAGRVLSVAFSPDGKLLASAGNDHTVRIWEWAVSGVDPLVFRGFESSVETVAFSPDGRSLASSRGDGSVLVWQCDVCGPVRQVLALADQRVTRVLTAVERAQFLHEEEP